jgi:hypothetical protein
MHSPSGESRVDEEMTAGMAYRVYKGWPWMGGGGGVGGRCEEELRERGVSLTSF